MLPGTLPGAFPAAEAEEPRAALVVGAGALAWHRATL